MAGLAAAFGTWLKAQVMAGLADAGALVIALDGKTVRGARARDGKAPHLLAAMITGALVTADAMHVRKETARYLVEDKQADYLFTAVKDNQPGVFAALDALDWPGSPASPPGGGGQPGIPQGHSPPRISHNENDHSPGTCTRVISWRSYPNCAGSGIRPPRKAARWLGQRRVGHPWPPRDVAVRGR